MTPQPPSWYFTPNPSKHHRERRNAKALTFHPPECPLQGTLSAPGWIELWSGTILHLTLPEECGEMGVNAGAGAGRGAGEGSWNEPAPCVCVQGHHIPLTSRVCNVEFFSRALPSAAPPSLPILLSACVRVAVHTQVPTNAPRCTPPTHDQRCHHRSAHSTQCSAFRPLNTTPFLMLWGMPQNSVRPQRPLHTLHTPVGQLHPTTQHRGL